MRFMQADHALECRLSKNCEMEGLAVQYMTTLLTRIFEPSFFITGNRLCSINSSLCLWARKEVTMDVYAVEVKIIRMNDEVTSFGDMNHYIATEIMRDDTKRYFYYW